MRSGLEAAHDAERTEWALRADRRLRAQVAAATLAERHAHVSRSVILENDALRVDLNYQIKQVGGLGFCIDECVLHAEANKLVSCSMQ